MSDCASEHERVARGSATQPQTPPPPDPNTHTHTSPTTTFTPNPPPPPPPPTPTSPHSPLGTSIMPLYFNHATLFQSRHFTQKLNGRRGSKGPNWQIFEALACRGGLSNHHEAAILLSLGEGWVGGGGGMGGGRAVSEDFCQLSKANSSCAVRPQSVHTKPPSHPYPPSHPSLL